MKRHIRMRRLRKAILGLAFATMALGSGAAVGVASGEPRDGHWRAALSFRSEALGSLQGLDDTPTFRTHAPEPEWQRALRVRSEGLNRAYGL